MEDELRQLPRGRRRYFGLTDMALYEYQCKKCGRKTEVIQLFSDPAPTKCPHCGGALAKLLSTPAFQFKGSGFYSTDYGKSGRKPEDSSKEKEGDSSKGKQGEGGAPSEAAAETKGGSAGDPSIGMWGPVFFSMGKSDSTPSAVSDGAAAKASNAPSSPSKKNSKRR
ncbi:MAG: FmdB family zinc ribbon protein [Thermoanaerobaculia bacterium]